MTEHDRAATPAPFAALVGIDWADRKHDICLLDLGTGKRESLVLPHTPEAIDDWACQLRQRFGNRSVAVCLEQSKGALVYALLKYDFLVLFPLNPSRLKSYRQAVTSSGAKDDPTDARFLLEYLECHRAHLVPWKPDDALTRQIGLVSEERRKAVNLRTQLGNWLRTCLKNYFPQALDLVGEDLHTRMACDFLLSWPTLESVEKASPQRLRKFYHAHNSRQEELIDRRIAAARAARPLTNDSALVQSHKLTATLLARQLLDLGRAIEAFDKELSRLMAEHPDAALFAGLPGAGSAMAPRLLAAFGSDRGRFAGPEALQTYSGIAPVTRRSGRSTAVHRRTACPRFLRQTFHEFAGHSVKHSGWAGAYYRLQRAHGHGHHAAVRSLAFKWIRVIYRCWKERTPYDEATYLAALRQKGSPLLAHLTSVAPTAGD
jgi:transposase